MYGLYEYVGGHPCPSGAWNRSPMLFLPDPVLLLFLFLLVPCASIMAFLTSQEILAALAGYCCLLALGGLTLCYLVSAVRSWARLRSVPGPWVASFSYTWLARVAASGRQAPIYQDLNKQYGSSLVRIGPNELTTDDPQLDPSDGWCP